MCYVHNQWYDISCATLYIIHTLHYIPLGICSLAITEAFFFPFLDCSSYLTVNTLQPHKPLNKIFVQNAATDVCM